MQTRLKRFVESGQLGPFSNAYWGSPAYKLPAEANLMAVTHYLEALDFQKEIVKIPTIFGGRNPHPNWLVGGMPCSFVVDDAGSVGAVNMAWQGKDIGERNRLDAADMLCGWGGAGAYSDGKLTLSRQVGGYLGEFLEGKALYDLLNEADQVYVRHGAPDRCGLLGGGKIDGGPVHTECRIRQRDSPPRRAGLDRELHRCRLVERGAVDNVEPLEESFRAVPEKERGDD